MKLYRLLSLIFFFGIVINQIARAQVSNKKLEALQASIIADGFENVGIVQEGKHCYVFFENRRYRWEIDGLWRVLKSAEDLCSDSLNVHIIPLHQQIPVSEICLAARTQHLQTSMDVPPLVTRQTIQAKMNTDSIKVFQDKTKLQNKSFGRIDLIFLPGLRIMLNNPAQPIEWMISISPILQTSLWKGNLLSIQAMIPLHNELQYEYEGKFRMETATINQLFRLPGNVFVYASGGVFGFINKNGPENYFQRYGISCDVSKYLFNGRLGLGLTAGYTGLMSIYDGYIHNYPTDVKMNFALFAEYRQPNLDLTGRLTGGRFIYDDYAVKLELSRQFREFTLSFFVIKSTLKSFTYVWERGSVGGIALNVPIAPKKSFKPAAFRVNLAKYFNFAYRLRNIDPIATSYNTNSDWNNMFRNLNPDFTEKYIQERY